MSADEDPDRGDGTKAVTPGCIGPALAVLTLGLVIAALIEFPVLADAGRWPFDERRPTVVTVEPLAVEGDRQPVLIPGAAGEESSRGNGESSRILAARYRIPAGWAVQKHTLQREQGTIKITAWRVSPGVPTGDEPGRRRAAVLATRLGSPGAQAPARTGPAKTRTVAGQPAVEVATADDRSSLRWLALHTYVFTGGVVVEVICDPWHEGWSDELRRGCAAVLATLEVPR